MKFKLTNTCFLFRRQHLMIIMRTFIFLFCTVVFSLVPNNLVSQNSKIKIEEDKTLTVDGVFKLIMDQTDYKFFYEKNLFKDFPVVHVKKGIIRTNELLKRSLSQGDLDITVTANKGILIKEKVPEIIKPQGIEISGTVTDKSGLPLVGANILEKGTSNGAQTDFDGNYSISVSNQDAVLIFSFIGFSTQEIPVGQSTTVNVSLEIDAQGLDEVVIVGYGTQERSKLTSSMTTIKAESLQDRPIVTIQQGLAGIDPGINVYTTDGGRPGEQPLVSIRGEDAQDDPALVLIDGFEGNINDVDPNQIKEISILKDASATAIYGVRASSGVILITTKSGRRNSAMQLTYRTRMSSQTATMIPEVLNAVELMEMTNRAEVNEQIYRDNRNDRTFVPSTLYPIYSEDVINRAKAGEFFDTNWNEMLYDRSATQISHTVEATGGSEKTSYLMSFGSLTQEGINVGNDNFKRYNMRLKLDTDINDWLTVGTNTAFIHSIQNRVPNEEKTRPNPLFPVTDDNDILGGAGNYVISTDGVANVLATSSDGSVRTTRRDVIEMQFYAKAKLVKGLTFDQKVNFRFSNEDFSRWENEIDLIDYSFNGQTGEYSTDGVNPANAANRYAQKGAFRNYEFTSQSLLNYELSLEKGHNFRALVGWQVEDRKNSGFLVQISDFLNESVTTLDVGNSSTLLAATNQGYNRDRAMLSLFGRVNYDYEGKYLLQASIRRDASSTFAAGNRDAVFPAVSAGWNIAKENFMENIGAVNLLKLRGSWGETGNDNLGTAEYVVRVAANDGYGWPSGTQSGLTFLNGANPNLTWETVEKIDFGVDLEMWNGKLGLTADIYKNTRTNKLESVSASREWGVTGRTFVNGNESQNKGWEIKITHRSKIGEVKYTASVNVSNTQNKWLNIIGGNPENIGSQTSNLVGFPASVRTGLLVDGIISSWEELDEYLAAHPNGFGNGAQNNQYVGSWRFVDVDSFDENGNRTGIPDGRIDIADRTILNDLNGLYKVGAQLGASYKGLSLSVLIDGSLSRETSMGSQQNAPFFTNDDGNVIRSFYEAAFDPANPDANAIHTIPFRTRVNYAGNPIQQADFIRVRNITLNYDINMADVSFIKRASIYASAENPFLLFNNYAFSEYGNDPEIAAGGDVNYPLQKTFSVGLNVTF